MKLEEKILFQNKHWGQGRFDTFSFKRDIYTNIWKDIDTKLIGLITGPRRVGKSVIIKQLINDLIKLKSIEPKQILFFEFSPKQKSETIWEVYKFFTNEVTNINLPIYIFFDEIQYVNGYESSIKEIYDNTSCKIFLTGSLSLSYKNKMEESLGGRFFAYKLLPLNFSEYLHLSNSENYNIYKKTISENDRFKRQNSLMTLNSEFRHFLEFGRFPEIINFSKEQSKSYISNVINQSLNQDVFSYFKIHKPQIISSLFNYFVENNGSLISINRLSKDLGVSNQTITLYINILEIMNLIYIVYNSKNPLTKGQSSKKVYVSSAFGLLESKFDIQTSMGFAVESYILERLLEKDETVTFWRKRQKEIDFLLPKKNIGYEVKFRSSFKPIKQLLKDYEVETISLDGKAPACLF